MGRPRGDRRGGGARGEAVAAAARVSPEPAGHLAGRGPAPPSRPAAPQGLSRPVDAAAVDAALGELDALVGLEQVKTLVRELAAFAAVQRWRAAAGLRAEPLVLHMVFSGNPGTGKTTVARILGRLLHGLGLLSRGQLVEAERADLVGEYIGHTAAKTRDLIQRALGGVLFVDEAYSLGRGGDRDFGREATDVLVKGMEDHRRDFALILAGYRQEMERFLSTNPGLRSRFPTHLDFPDYSVEELLRIADGMVAERQYRWTPAARLRLAELLRAPSARAALATGNARLVRNTVERAMRRQAVRLFRAGTPPPGAPAALSDLLPEDLLGSARDFAGPPPPPPGAVPWVLERRV
jgi:stage V sporulation protein K